MIWLLWKLLTLPLRVVFGTLGVALRAVRFVGIGRLVTFAAGVAAGLAVAPGSGRALRDRVVSRYGNAAVVHPDLAETVRHELAQSPRTWHLPQPSVTAEGDRVTLTGEAPHETGRGDLARTAGAVVGVAAVDNRITVATGAATTTRAAAVDDGTRS